MLSSELGQRYRRGGSACLPKLLGAIKMRVAPDRVSGDHQAEPHAIATLVTFGKALSREACHLVIMVMPAMTYLVDS
jgi:hypothetical protein